MDKLVDTKHKLPQKNKRFKNMVYCTKKGEMSMTVDPKQVKDLVTTFCELDEEYREKALTAVNKVFFEYIANKECNQRNIPVTEKNQTSIYKEIIEILKLLQQLDETQEASVAIFMEHLQPGSFTEESELQITLNQKRLSINEYIEKVLPNANIKDAKKWVEEFEEEKGYKR